MNQGSSICVSGLHAGYGRIPVLHGIDIKVDSGEIVGVLGHNGMGKTTLLKALMGFLPADSGSIRLEGTDFTREPPQARARGGVGYVPQGRGILASLTAEENLRLGYLAGGGRAAETEALAQMLELFPRLKRLLARKGGLLSGGEQQLLSLARALMSKPRLILLDEPTEGIQPNIVEELAQTLLQLREANGLSVLVVEQNLDFLRDCAGRLLMLGHGRIRSEVKANHLQDLEKLAEFLELSATAA